MDATTAVRRYIELSDAVATAYVDYCENNANKSQTERDGIARAWMDAEAERDDFLLSLGLDDYCTFFNDD